MTLAELSLSGGPLYAILPAALGELWREIRDVADKDYNGHFVKNVFLFNHSFWKLINLFFTEIYIFNFF